MRKTGRTPLPQPIVAEVLFRSDHTCCICRVPHKDVQIHHIDGNPANNSFANLAVVCLDCHSKVSGHRGLGRAFLPSEVRRYKVSWEADVRRSRRVHRPAVAFRRELISQVDLIVCDILARRSDQKRAFELLDLLFELHLWRGNRALDARIVEGLRHLAVMTGLSYPRLSPRIAELLWEMCSYFVGPDKVKMGSAGEKHVLDCVDALETLAEFNCSFGHGRRAIDTISETAEQFLDIAIWYRRSRIARAVVKCYEEGMQGCYEYGKIQFPYGRRRLRLSVNRALKTLTREKVFSNYRSGLQRVLTWKPK